MNFHLTFADPPPLVQQARLAMARLQQHLVETLDPLDPSCDLSSLAFAFLELEAVHPPYTPLPVHAEASVDPREDYDLAVCALIEAMRSADRVVDKVRFALAIRLLLELQDSPPIGPRSSDGAEGPHRRPEP